MTFDEKSRDELIRHIKELEKRVAEFETSISGNGSGTREATEGISFRKLAETAPVGIFIVQDLNFLYTNPAMTELTGYSSEELKSKKPWDLVHPDMRELVEQRALARAQGEAVEQRYVMHCQNKAGDSVWIDFFAETIKIEGKPAILGTAVDITSRRLAENKLAESEEKYRTLVEGSENAIFTVDHEGTFLFMNKATATYLGGTPEDFIGKTQWDIFPRSVADRQMERIRRVFETGEGFSIEAPTVVGGKEHVFHTICRPLLNAAGNVVAAICSSHDHSELKEARNALSKLEERYHSLVDSLPVGIFQATPEGKVVSANPALVRMYGCDSVEEYLALPDRDSFSDPSKRDKIVSILREKVRISDYEVQMRRKDGSYFWISLSAYVVLDESGAVSHYDGIEADITERKLATDALKQSGKTMSALLNAPTQTLFLMDIQGILLSLNEAMAEKLGRSVEELIGTCGHDYIPAPLVESRKVKELEVIESGKPVEYVDECDGIWHEIRLYPVFDNRGTVEAIAVYSLDITERKRAETERERAREFMQTLIDGFPESVMVINRDYTVALANRRIREMVGGQDPVATCLKCHQVSHKSATPCDDTKEPCPLKQVVATKVPVTVEHIHYDAEDHAIAFEIIAAPIFDEAGEVVQIIESARDITERKRAEEVLKQYHEHLEELVDERTAQLRASEQQLKASNQQLRASDQQLREANHDLGERVKGLNCLYGISHLVESEDTLLEKVFQGTCNLIKESWQYPEITCARIVVNGTESKTADFRTTQWKQFADIKLDVEKIGQVEVYYLKSMPELDEGPFSKEERDLINAIADRLGTITERKRAEEALQESEVRFRTIYENAPVLINAFDENGGCVLWNKQCREIFGWTIDEINAHDDALVLFYPDPAVRDEVMRTVTTRPDGRFREWHPVTKDGKTLTTMWANFRLPDGMAFNLGYDITERKQTEEKLRQYRDHLEDLVEERTSELRQEITERKLAKEALKESEDKFRRIAERSFDAIFITNMEGSLTYVSPAVETLLGYPPEEMLCRNLSEFVREASLKDVGQGFAEVSQGRAVEGQQFEVIGSDGETVYVEANSTPIIQDGRVVGNQAIVRNISERRRAEEMLKQTYDEQSRQLRQVAGGLAHDIYNDLFPVAAGIHKLRRRLLDSNQPVEERNRKLLDLMDSAVRRAIDLTESVNLYSRLDRSEIDAGANLASTIDDVANQNRDRVSELDISLEIHVPDTIDVACPRTQTFHLFNNLLLNAIDAVQDSATRSIRISASQDDKQVRIEFEDSGHGIPTEALSRMFDPFFSTKPKTGTGLGLAIVRRIVDLSGGEINVQTSLDKGTAFTIILLGNVSTQK